MDNKNYCFNSSILDEELTESPEMVTDEITNITDDQGDAVMIVQDESNFIPTSPINDNGISIELGVSQPSQVVNSPIVANDQPFELDGHHGEPAVEIPYTLSPTTWTIAEDFEVPLSPEIQNVTVHDNITYDITLLNNRETLAEPVQDEDNDIEVLFTETIAIQTVESPIPHVPINNDIHNVPTVTIDIIDLTQDVNDNEEIQPAVVSPVVIDLTQDDIEQDVSQTQLVLPTDHVNDNEQINQPENDPTIGDIRMTGRLPPLTGSPSEATDQNSNFATEIEIHNPTIETAAHLQVPILLSRASKRSKSSDGTCHIIKKHTAGKVKRCRKSLA